MLNVCFFVLPSILHHQPHPSQVQTGAKCHCLWEDCYLYLQMRKGDSERLRSSPETTHWLSEEMRWELRSSDSCLLQLSMKIQISAFERV